MLPIFYVFLSDVNCTSLQKQNQEQFGLGETLGLLVQALHLTDLKYIHNCVKAKDRKHVN